MLQLSYSIGKRQSYLVHASKIVLVVDYIYVRMTHIPAYEDLSILMIRVNVLMLSNNGSLLNVYATTQSVCKRNRKRKPNS